MSPKIPEPTQAPRERAFLVGVEIHGQETLLPLQDSLSELARLAETAGLEVVGELTQRLERPNPQTLLGRGKVEELKALVEDTLAQVVIFDDELSPRHQRELERALGEKVRVLDRTALILDIFAQHAHTSDGQLQVKLAQYEYYLPRLTGRRTQLAQQTGGGGGRSGSLGVGLRGPGETQLEVDRRVVRRQIAHLKAELEKVRSHRLRYRAQRRRARIPTVALVGYTNAGKSTLLNRLARANVYVADQLFATLDPTTRRVLLPDNHLVLFTDTVGFIQKLPTTLVAAFRATLEEIAEAELLLHVVDIAHPNAIQQAEAVHATLEEIGAGHIPMLVALNKIDLLHDRAILENALHRFPQAVAISAQSGEGIPAMLERIAGILYNTYTFIQVFLPYSQGQLIALFHEAGQVERAEHTRKGVYLRGRVPGRVAAYFQPWQVETASPTFVEDEDVPLVKQDDR